MPVRSKFMPPSKAPVVSLRKILTLMAQYSLIPGMEFGAVYVGRIVSF